MNNEELSHREEMNRLIEEHYRKIQKRNKWMLPVVFSLSLISLVFSIYKILN